MYAINFLGVLRVSAEGEKEGLDLHEHGISAYPEYLISEQPVAVFNNVASKELHLDAGVGMADPQEA
jgi:hypothetical protein